MRDFSNKIHIHFDIASINFVPILTRQQTMS